MVMQALKDIATLFSGFPLGFGSFVNDGNAWAIQSRTIDWEPASLTDGDGGDGIEDVEPSHISFMVNSGDMKIRHSLNQVNIRNLTEDKMLMEGDVLLRSRASNFEKLEAFVPFRNAQFTRMKDKPYVVSNTFIVLRPKINIVLPVYLEWVLNNFRERMQKYLQGSNIIYSISIRDLREVTLPVPDIKSQEHIVSIVGQIEKYRVLYEAFENSTQKMLRGLALQHSQGGQTK